MVDKANIIDIREEDQFGDTEVKAPEEIEQNLYEAARTRAYSTNHRDGFTGFVIYAMLVYYALRLALVYAKRAYNIIILTLLAPIVSGAYAFNKVMSGGKSQIFKTWLSEYIMTVAIQTSNALVYAAFISIAIQLSLSSLPAAALTFVILQFMINADKLLRQLFKLVGSDGSLAGSLDNTTFGGIKDEFNKIKDGITGGVITKAAMGATYGALGNIAGTGLDVAVGATSAAIYNSASYQKKKNKEKAEEEKNQKDKFEDFQKKKFGDEESQKKADEHRKKIKELEKEKAALEAKLTTAKEDEKEDILNEITQKKSEITANELKIKKIFEEAYGEHKVRNKKMKDRLAEALDAENFVEVARDKNGKVKTRADGSVIYKGQSIRRSQKGWKLLGKRKSSPLLSLKENANPIELLTGLNSSEVDILKDELKDLGSTVGGVVSGMAVLPAMAISPMLGFSAMAYAFNTKLKISTRQLNYAKRVRTGQADRYKFKRFGNGSQNVIRNALNELTYVYDDKFEDAYQKKVKSEYKKVRNDMLKNQISEVKKDLKSEFEEYKKNIQKDSNVQTNKNMIIEEMIATGTAVQVGNSVLYMQDNDDIKSLKNKIKRINNNTSFNAKQKKEEIQKEIEKRKDGLLKDSITELAAKRGENDIEKMNLKVDDCENVRKIFSEKLQSLGVIDRGDLASITLDDNDILNKKFEMKNDSTKNNAEIEKKMVANAIVDYINQNGITDVKDLEKDKVKKEIRTMVVDKMLTDAERQTADATKALNGGKDVFREKYIISSNLENLVNNSDVHLNKKTNRALNFEANSANNRELKRRRNQRKINEFKQKLEQYAYTGRADNITENDLDAIFKISELTQLNEEYAQVSTAAEKDEIIQKAKMFYAMQGKELDLEFDRNVLYKLAGINKLINNLR